MRLLIGLLAGLAVTTGASAMPFAPIASPAPTLVEYFCSGGFAPRGGRCVATAARDEIEFFQVDPDRVGTPRVHHRHHRHSLRTLY